MSKASVQQDLIFRGNTSSGFTLVEIMVAMVVLAIGLLGMAAMTILVVKGNRSAASTTSATNVCQLKVEELKDVAWLDLGTALNAEDADALSWGIELAQIAQEGSFDDKDTLLNGQGKTFSEVCDELYPSVGCGSDAAKIDEARKRGPYAYSRSFVICSGLEYDSVTGAPPDGTDDFRSSNAEHPPSYYDCMIDPTDEDTRVEALACVEDDIITPGAGVSREKKIKVLCSWLSRDGRCHSVSFATTQMNLD